MKTRHLLMSLVLSAFAVGSALAQPAPRPMPYQGERVVVQQPGPGHHFRRYAERGRGHHYGHFRHHHRHHPGAYRR